MKTVLLEQLSFEAFAKLVKTKFRVWNAAKETVDLELIEATRARNSSPAGTSASVFESFSLVFVGPGERVLSQRCYWFECARIGRFELFIVPIGRDQNGVRYEAAFNRRLNG